MSTFHHALHGKRTVGSGGSQVDPKREREYTHDELELFEHNGPAVPVLGALAITTKVLGAQDKLLIITTCTYGRVIEISGRYKEIGHC